MRQMAVVMGVLIATLAAVSAEVRVTSDPPGAEVWVSPADQPGIYKKGITPCSLSLSPSARPYRLLLKLSGYFPVFRTLSEETNLTIKLASRDDPPNWQAVPLIGDVEGAVPIPGDIPAYPSSSIKWAADGEGLLVQGVAWSSYVEQIGLARKGENRDLADLWYAPLRGKAMRLWRYLSEPDVPGRFKIDSASGPDGRWVVHSAPTGDREHLELHCLNTGAHQAIAREIRATLFCPAFSADGRRIACLRISRAQDKATDEAFYVPDDPPAEIQIMQWNGCDRRTVLKDVYRHLPPAFSPDGARLAYVTTDRRIGVIPVTGGEPRLLIDSPSWRAAGAPVWSPDGQTIAADFGYLDRRDDLQGGVDRVLWARLDGTASGAIPSVTLHGWHDTSTLDVYAAGYCAAAAQPYRRLLRVGLDGSHKTVLYEPRSMCHHAVTSDDGRRVAALECGPDGRQSVVLAMPSPDPQRRFSPQQLSDATGLGWLDDTHLWVALIATADGPPAYSLDLTSGALTPLSEVPARPPRDHFDGPPSPQYAAKLGGFALPRGWIEALAPTIPFGGETR